MHIVVSYSHDRLMKEKRETDRDKKETETRDRQTDRDKRQTETIDRQTKYQTARQTGEQANRKRDRDRKLQKVYC